MITRRISVCLCFVFFTISCVSHKNETIILSEEISRDPLSIKFKLFVVHELTINECLIKINEYLKTSKPSQPTFLWSTRFYGKNIYKPDQQPRVNIKLYNVRMEDVFDEICKQTGWIYKRVPYGFTFEKSE